MATETPTSVSVSPRLRGESGGSACYAASAQSYPAHLAHRHREVGATTFAGDRTCRHGQAVVGPGIVIGGGFGVQYTKATEDFEDQPFAAAILAGGGFRPRFLLSAGFAF